MFLPLPWMVKLCVDYTYMGLLDKWFILTAILRKSYLFNMLLIWGELNICPFSCALFSDVNKNLTQKMSFRVYLLINISVHIKKTKHIKKCEKKVDHPKPWSEKYILFHIFSSFFYWHFLNLRKLKS